MNAQICRFLCEENSPAYLDDGNSAHLVAGYSQRHNTSRNHDNDAAVGKTTKEKAGIHNVVSLDEDGKLGESDL